MRKKTKKETNKLSDEDLVDEICSGSKEAFEILVNRYTRKSYALAYSILENEEDAKDVVQECFVKMYEKIQHFKKASSFSTWYYRIVVNHAFSFRKKKRFRYTVGSLLGLGREPAVESEGQKKIQSNEKRKVLQDALNQLKPNEKIVLQMFYLEQKTIKEINEITGFGESKIKVNLHRGREKMNQKIKLKLGENAQYLL